MALATAAMQDSPGLWRP